MIKLPNLAKITFALVLGIVAQATGHAQLTWTWSFSAPAGGGNVADFEGSGTLTTSATPNTNGQYLVTAITGTWSVNSVSTSVTGPVDFDGSDNLITLNSPQVEMSGLGFTASGTNYNIYNSGGPDLVDSQLVSDPTGPVTTESGVFSAQMSAVPEPSTYALICGAAALGFAFYRRRAAHAAV